MNLLNTILLAAAPPVEHFPQWRCLTQGTADGHNSVIGQKVL